MPIKSHEMARLRLQEALLPLNSTVDFNHQKEVRKKEKRGRHICAGFEKTNRVKTRKRRYTAEKSQKYRLRR